MVKALGIAGFHQQMIVSFVLKDVNQFTLPRQSGEVWVDENGRYVMNER